MSQSVYSTFWDLLKLSLVKVPQVKSCGWDASWGEEALPYMTLVSGEATSTGVEEAIYVGAGATGKKYLS